MESKQQFGYETIVENIRQIISDKCLKQGSVAIKAGFTEQEFSNMLNDRRKLIRVEFIPNIARGLGVDVNDIYSYKLTNKETG